MRTNFQMEYQNITMIRGDTLSFNVEVIDKEGNPITADSAFFTCKKAIVNEIVFQKSLNSGISQSDGLMCVRVAPEDTADIDQGRYYYDFQIGVGNDVFTIMIGMLSIEQDIS